MTRSGAILAGARAARAQGPGGARPTPGPQSTQAPNFGQISPLAADLANEGGYARSYGSFLPRPTEDFTQGAFGPFSPILPVPVDQPPEGAERPGPRRYQYQVGWNLPVGQPGTEGLKLADFGTLKTICDLYSVARACIETRKKEIRGLDWDITPTPEAAKAYQGSPSQMKDFGKRRAEAIKFFRHPDPNYFSWTTWLDALLEEVFVWDALSILLRPKWGKGMGKGLLGSDLDSLELVDGSSIRPLIDLNGGIPRPPAPAYQQYLYGVPRSDLMTMITQRDIDEGGIRGSELGKYRGDQLLYLPVTQRIWTPYGFPPAEQAIIPIRSGLNKQIYQLTYYTEGTVPAVFISPGDVNMTPNQLRELQDALNAIAGDIAFKHKIIVLPPGSHIDPMRPGQLADEFDEIVMSQVCMAFDVQPTELGIFPKLSGAGAPLGAGAELARAQQQIHERKSTKPLLAYLSDLFEAILHRVAGQDDMQFTWEGLQEEEDEEKATQTLTQQINTGLRSIDEGREVLKLQPWGLPETSEPIIITPTGPVPLATAIQQAEASGQASVAGSQAAAHAISQGKMPPPGTPGGPKNAPEPGPEPGPGAEPGPSAGGKAGEQTPGHQAAEAGTQSAGTAKPGAAGTGHASAGGASPGGAAAQGKADLAAGKKDLAAAKNKAASSELEALARHLKKGRHITTWEARHVPGAVLAMISEDLNKGLTPDQAVSSALKMLPADLPKASTAWESEIRGHHGEWESGDGSSSAVTASSSSGIPEISSGRPTPREAVWEYMARGWAINNQLRSGQSLTKDDQGIVNVIDSLMKPSDKPMTLLRGISGASEIFGRTGSKTGEAFRDAGFTSTTTKKSVARWFMSHAYWSPSEGRDKAIVRIRADAGTPMAEIAAYHESSRNGEYVLPRGSSFRVTGDAVNDKGLREIDLSVVPSLSVKISGFLPKPRQEFLEKPFVPISPAITVPADSPYPGVPPDLVGKVGPKGYVHGWKFVGVPGSSKQIHSTASGKYTDKRHALHQKLIRNAIAGFRPSSSPTATFLGGGPAAGKSSILAGNKGLIIAADDIKEKLPEYKKGVPESAPFVHEESTDIAQGIKTSAEENRIDYTLDGTGDTSYSSMVRKVDSAHSAGYRAKAKYVTIDTDEAVRRAMKRGEETGRYVPESVIRAKHATVTNVFRRAIKNDLFDSAELWDNNDVVPHLIGEKKEGGTWQVHDQKAWQKFLGKEHDVGYR